MTQASQNDPPRSAPDWREIDWSQHERTTTVFGLRLNYVDYGTGDVVLLVHGLGGSWQTWLENIPALGLDHRVIAVDLPGFGRSEALPPDAELADHVEALTDLLDRLHIPEAVVVGHSLGGLVTLCTASWKSDRVRALVLVSGGGVELSPVRLTLMLAMFRVFRTVFGIPGVATAVAARPFLRRLLLGAALGDWRSLSAELAAIQVPLMSSPGFIATARAAAAALPTVRPELIDTPSLLIWGRRDRFLPVAAARTLAVELPDARLEILDGVGHCAMFEAPESVNTLVLAFLEEHRTAGSAEDSAFVQAIKPIDKKEMNRDQRAG